ncbi:MAG: hypothetical protein ACF8QF_05415 [Phycisphaerales bacterium]
MSELTPVERFFGLSATRGPFDLLGLLPGHVPEERVLEALRRRLQRLDDHPHARSLEADEARLALHTAAAQLLDPVVRAHIIEHIEGGEDGSAGRPAAPPDLAAPPTPAPARRPEPADARLGEFREASFLLVRGGGGWNRRSLHRVAALAHAYGLSAEEVRRAFHMQGAPGAPRPRWPGPVAPVRPATDAPRARKAPASPVPAVIGTLTGVAIIVVLTAVVLTPVTGRTERSAPEPEAPVQPEDRRRAEAQATPTDPGGPIAIVNEGNVFETLSRSVSMAPDDPGEAAWRFEAAVEWIADHWPAYSLPRRDEALAGVAAFLHATPAGGSARRRAVQAIGDGATRLAADGAPSTGDLTPGAWSVGVLNALSRDRELDAALQLELRGRIVAAVGQAMPEDASFQAGVLSAMRAVVGDLVGASGERLAQAESVSLWQEWGQVLDAASAGSRASAARRHALLLDASQRLLLEGPSPADNPAARVGLTAALARLAWGPSSLSPEIRAAGARLVAWFDDEAIPTRDLAVATEWLATEANAPGVTFAMVIPRSASRETRAAYRDRYAEAWGLASAEDRTSLEAAWSAAARAEHALVGREVGVAASIARAATLARLNEAGALRWRRETDRARRLIDNPSGPVERAFDTSGDGRRLDPGGRDTDWVVAFIAGPSNESARLAALADLERRGGPLSRVEGDVLAEAALWGAPAEVRRRAQWLVREHADDPALVNGVLESLPRAPKTRQTADLLEEIAGAALPGPGDPDFEIAARRALVSRLLELLAGEGELGVIDRLGALLASSYVVRAGVESPARTAEAGAPPAIDAPAAQSLALTPAQGAEALRTAWEREATRYSPNPYAPRSIDEIRRRREARLRLAGGAVQVFVAEQVAIAELMAAVVSAERPDAAGEVERILELYDEARRSAQHIGQQLEAGEDAMLQLWAIRFGEAAFGPPRAGGGGR